MRPDRAHAGKAGVDACAQPGRMPGKAGFDARSACAWVGSHAPAEGRWGEDDAAGPRVTLRVGMHAPAEHPEGHRQARASRRSCGLMHASRARERPWVDARFACKHPEGHWSGRAMIWEPGRTTWPLAEPGELESRNGEHAVLAEGEGIAGALSAARCRAGGRALRRGCNPPPPAQPEMHLPVRAVMHSPDRESDVVLGPAGPARSNGVEGRDGGHGRLRDSEAGLVPTRPPPPRPEMHNQRQR